MLLNRDDVHVNQAMKEGFTPLYSACQNGHLDVVKALLKKKGVQVNQQVLCVACKQGHLNVVNELLITESIQVNQPDHTGETAFILAITYGHLEVVQLLLRHNGIAINQVNHQGFTPLYVACMKGNLEMVQLLLLEMEMEEEINVNQSNLSGQTPLIIAITLGHVDIIQLLLQHDRIDCNQTMQGYTPLKIAQMYNKRTIVQLLIQAGATIPQSQPVAKIRRGTDDVEIGLYTDTTCKNGCGLVRYFTTNDRCYCDACRCLQPAYSIVYGCDECDYDLCESCVVPTE